MYYYSTTTMYHREDVMPQVMGHLKFFMDSKNNYGKQEVLVPSQPDKVYLLLLLIIMSSKNARHQFAYSFQLFINPIRVLVVIQY